jgi:hypothetical protein
MLKYTTPEAISAFETLVGQIDARVTVLYALICGLFGFALVD